jgi:hypothetical protein
MAKTNNWVVGDRFKYYYDHKVKWITWEITGPVTERGQYPSIITDSLDGSLIGYISEYDVDMSEEVYLGNFSKSSSFTDLYDKLAG